MEHEPAPETIRKTDKVPLWQKMYFRACYTDIVRLVGYAGLPLSEAQAGMKELERTHKKESLATACDDLLDITAEFVRLKAETRKLSWQLLGPSPEQRAAFNGRPDASPRRGKHAAAAKPPRPQKATAPTREVKPRSKGAPRKPVPKAPKKRERQSDPAETASPILQQYQAAKERHPGMLLLFRMGDFYELFDEDAETVHRLLGLTLTTRDRTTAMAGFPHHQLEAYLHKLLKNGHRVAVCEPVDAPVPNCRDVTRVVTPGSTDDADGS